MEINEKLRLCREYRGVSRQQLADYLGISMKTVAALESGNRVVQPSQFTAICKFLDIPQGFFLVSITSIEDYLARVSSQEMLLNTKKYKEYLELIDAAKDKGTKPQEFLEVLRVIRFIKNID